MDRDFLKNIDNLVGKTNVAFSVGHNTHFNRVGNRLFVQYKSENGQTIEQELRPIEQLVEGTARFESTDEEWYDAYLPLLTSIETAIARFYEAQPHYRDKMVLSILDRLIMKPDINIQNELLMDIQANIRLILSTTKYSKNELMGCLKKIRRSVKRHHAVDGPTGYLDFIKGRV